MSSRDFLTVLVSLTAAVIFWAFHFSDTVEVPFFHSPEYDLPADGEEISAEYGAESTAESAAESSRWSFRIDPNEAPLGDLVILPGIGPVLGEKIIHYRTENEPFRQPPDLEKINGIGPKKRAKIERYLIFP